MAYLIAAQQQRRLTFNGGRFTLLARRCRTASFTSARLLYHECVLTSRCYIRAVTDIKGERLIDIAPHYFDLSNFPPGDARRALERMYAKKERGGRNTVGEGDTRRALERMYAGRERGAAAPSESDAIWVWLVLVLALVCCCWWVWGAGVTTIPVTVLLSILLGRLG
jgi:hypothetical protein